MPENHKNWLGLDSVDNLYERRCSVLYCIYTQKDQ